MVDFLCMPWRDQKACVVWQRITECPFSIPVLIGPLMRTMVRLKGVFAVAEGGTQVNGQYLHFCSGDIYLQGKRMVTCPGDMMAANGVPISSTYVALVPQCGAKRILARG